MDSKKLQTMKLHETLEVETESGQFDILRVPGGWIYYAIYNDIVSPGVFVPKVSEFSDTKISIPKKPKNLNW